MPVLPSMLADASLPSHVEFSVSEATAMNAAIDSENAAVASAPALAGRAVEAVLTAADRLAAGDRSSVRLEFAMGESELSVRVAMRDNAVRATFQTDSAELRAALAHEWQLMTSEHGDRSFQFAPPAFQTGQGEASGQGTLAGDFSRHQREGQASRANEHEFTGPSRGQRETEAGSPAAVEPGRTELPGYSLHLHTLA